MAQSRLRVLAIGLGFVLTGAPVVAQVPRQPDLPAGLGLPQGAQMPQTGLGDLIRQRIQQSGLTPDQIRARLRSAGYSESLVDAYLGAATPGRPAPAPGSDVLRAMSALGFSDLALAFDTLALRDSLQLSRDDSLFLDSLGILPSIDSIPSKRDSLGVLRLDSAGALRLSERTRAPRLFGLDVFRRASTLFTPLQNGPVDAEYRLGPGDELVLIVTGEVELAHVLPVTRDGLIVIPLAGQVYVANLTLGQLREVLYTRLGRVYSGVQRGATARTRFEVTVSKVRVNQVFVNGEVARPGAYAVSAVGTVMNALYQAGGPTERGNFRQVRILRGGREVTTLDLYDYLLRGSTRNDVRLENGDVVFVPPRERRVAVMGSVLRPAIYDLGGGEGLRETIAMAGGLLPEADVTRALIERILPPDQRAAGGRDRTVLSVDLRDALGQNAPVYPLEADDRVTVYAVSRPVRNQVVLRGNVWRPGVYRAEVGLTLSGLLAQAGGTKSDTYTDRVHILRLEPDSTRRLLATSLAPGAADPVLEEFDEVTVFSTTSFRPQRQVSVFGSVQRPGLHAFRDSMTLMDAIMLAGGLRDEAYLLEAEISRLPSGSGDGRTLAEIIRVPLDSSFVLDPTGYIRRPTGDRGQNPALAPYDNVFIRRVPGFEIQRNVVLSGEVRFPGRYSLTRRDERVADVLERAGGLTDAAYVRGAQFFRAESRAGRVGIELDRVLRDRGHRDNLILMAGDSLHVPPFQPVVVVEGAVNSPVAVAYVPGQSAGFYVDRAGGFARRADRKRTYVVQPNGAVHRRDARVEPGARVVVPEVPADERRTEWRDVLPVVASILTSAVTIIVVVSR